MFPQVEECIQVIRETAGRYATQSVALENESGTLAPALIGRQSLPSCSGGQPITDPLALPGPHPQKD